MVYVSERPERGEGITLIHNRLKKDENEEGRGRTLRDGKVDDSLVHFINDELWYEALYVQLLTGNKCHSGRMIIITDYNAKVTRKSDSLALVQSKLEVQCFGAYYPFIGWRFPSGKRKYTGFGFATLVKPLSLALS